MSRSTLLICVLLTMCIESAVSQTKQLSSTEQSRLHDVVSQMFEAGIGAKRSATKAQALFEQAKRISPNDSRVIYAWGLIQHRRMKRDEAMELFAKAADGSSQTYFPARKTAIWLLIGSTKNRKKGLMEIQTLAQQLADANDEQRRSERVATARWVSEILAAVKKTTTKAAAIAEIEAVEQKIRPILDTAGLSDSWAAGRLAIENRYSAELQDDAARIAAAAKKAEADSKTTISKIEKRLKELNKDSKTSELDKTDLRAAIHETLSRIAAEFGRLDRDYQFLDRKARSVRLSIDDVLKRITAFQTFGRTNPGRLGRGGANLPQQLQQQQQNNQELLLQQELARWQGEYWSIVDQANGIVAQANNLGGYRNRVIQDFERRTGEIVKKQNEMSKWTTRLKQRKKKVRKDDVTSKQKPKRPKKITFRMLMPFDIKAERDRLLATFATVAVGEAPKPKK